MQTIQYIALEMRDIAKIIALLSFTSIHLSHILPLTFIQL